MQSRSSSRLVINPSSNLTLSTNPNPKGRNRRRSKQRIEDFNLEEPPPIVTMADQRTMAQLLQASTEGYEDAIVIPAITADNFELKHGFLTLVQNKQFFGHDNKDPHAHVRYFNKITSTLKLSNVPNASIKLMLFPFSLEGAARIWLKKEPPRLIFTWDDLVSKFINQFFPPSKTTNLRNEITNFQQRFDESFSEAWDRFKDLLRACPHHGFLELHQLDTFYSASNSKDQDSLNSAAGGNFLDKMSRGCLAIIKRKSKVRYSRNKPVVAKLSTNTSTFGISPDVAELKDMVKALLLDKKSQSSAPVKAVEESCVTCGGAHSYRNYPATDGNVYRNNIQEFVSQASAVNYNQRNTSYRPPMMSNQICPPGFPPTNLTDLITKFVNSNSASTLSSGTLPSNTIANPRSDLNAITTRSGVSYDGPQIPPSPSFLPKVVENELEATKDIVNPTNNGSTKDVQPQVVQSKFLVLTSKPVTSPISEPVIASVSALKPNPKTSSPYTSRRNDERNREKANNQIEKFYQIFKDMSFENNFTDALILMPKFASILKALIGNKEKLSEMDRTSLNEHCSVVLLKKLPKKLGDPGKFLIPCDFPELADHSISHPVGVVEDVYVETERALIDFFEGKLTLRVGKEAITFNLDQTSRYSANYSDKTAKRINVIDTDCEDDFLLEEVDAFLAVEDDPTSLEFYQLYLDPEGDILLLEAFLNDDPSLPPPNQGNYLPSVHKELKICEAKSNKSTVDEPPAVELKDLPPHLKYTSWKEVGCFRCSVAPYPLSPRVPLPPAMESDVHRGVTAKALISFKDFSKRLIRISNLSSREAAICWSSKELEGEEDRRGVFVLTLESVTRLREYLTLDILSIIAKPSQGILSKKLPHAAESKAS
nr:reverse transcriptase domain-containing protein [Tanacetum cinerariifolium]